MDHTPGAVRSLQVAALSSSRAFFIAGVSYYEIGRHGFARDDDNLYLTLLTGAFALAVVSAAISSYATHYTESTLSPVNQERFAGLSLWWTRLSYKAFLLAFLFYLASYTRVGWVYYRDSSNRWLPFAMAFVVCAVITALSVHLYRAHADVIAGKTNFQKDDSAQKRFKMEPAWKNVKEGTLHTFLSTQATSLADKAVFVVGFSQSGVARFIIPDEADARATVFLVFACLSAGFALICGIGLTLLLVVLADLENDSQREQLSRRMLGVWKLTGTSFFMALFFLMWSLVFTGWGCGFKDEAHIPAAVGAVGIVLLLGAMTRGDKTYAHVISLPESPDDDSELHDLAYKPLLQSAGSISFPGTVAASFTYYNVVTFATDVVALDISDNFPKTFLLVNCLAFGIGIVSVMYATLIQVWLQDLPRRKQRAIFARDIDSIARLCFVAFVVAMTCFLITFSMYGVTKFSRQQAAPTITSVLGIGVTAALVVTVMRAKAAAGKRALGFTAASTSAAAAEAKRMMSGAASSQAPSTPVLATDTETFVSVANPMSLADIPLDTPQLRKQVTTPANTHAELSLSDAQAQLSEFSGRSLFWGSFSFFAVNFLFASERTVSVPYVTVLGLAFSCSVALMLTVLLVSIVTATLSGSARKRSFALSLRSVRVVAFVLFLTTHVCFHAGFAMIGYIKTVLDYEDYAPVMLVGGVVAIVVGGALLGRIVLDSAVVSALPATEVAADEDASPYKLLLREVSAPCLSASFVAGNVFFEVLFSDVTPLASRKGFNFAYFGMATIALVLGSTVTLMGTAMQVALLDQSGTPRRNRLAIAFRNLRLPRLTFVLFNVALFAWMGSLIVMGTVKYWRKWRISCAWGLLATAVMGVSWFRLRFLWKRVQDGVGDTESLAWRVIARPVGPIKSAADALCLVAQVLLWGGFLTGTVLILMLA